MCEDALRHFTDECAENKAVSLNLIAKSYFCRGNAEAALEYNSRAFDLISANWSLPSPQGTLLHYRILFLCALDRPLEARHAISQFHAAYGFLRDQHLYAMGQMSQILST